MTRPSIAVAGTRARLERELRHLMLGNRGVGLTSSEADASFSSKFTCAVPMAGYSVGRILMREGLERRAITREAGGLAPDQSLAGALLSRRESSPSGKSLCNPSWRAVPRPFNRIARALRAPSSHSGHDEVALFSSAEVLLEYVNEVLL